MKPTHKHFFSSLKQVEKRLKLDDKTPPPPLPQPQPQPQPQTLTQQTESSSSSPIYFLDHHTTTSSTLNDNNPPHEFLSITDTNNFQSNPQLNNPENNLSQNDTVGDIGTMIQLLGLSEFDGKVLEMMSDVVDEEFYENIVKVKGVKCKKEVKRLDGWISYLARSGREPLRLAHLLMAKAAVGGGGGDGDVLEFPVTVDEFLRFDPPSD